MTYFRILSLHIYFVYNIKPYTVCLLKFIKVPLSVLSIKASFRDCECKLLQRENNRLFLFDTVRLDVRDMWRSTLVSFVLCLWIEYFKFSFQMARSLKNLRHIWTWLPRYLTKDVVGVMFVDSYFILFFLNFLGLNRNYDAKKGCYKFALTIFLCLTVTS